MEMNSKTDVIDDDRKGNNINTKIERKLFFSLILIFI